MLVTYTSGIFNTLRVQSELMRLWAPMTEVCKVKSMDAINPSQPWNTTSLPPAPIPGLLWGDRDEGQFHRVGEQLRLRERMVFEDYKNLQNNLSLEIGI